MSPWSYGIIERFPQVDISTALFEVLYVRTVRATPLPQRASSLNRQVRHCPPLFTVRESRHRVSDLPNITHRVNWQDWCQSCWAWFWLAQFKTHWNQWWGSRGLEWASSWGLNNEWRPWSQWRYSAVNRSQEGESQMPHDAFCFRKLNMQLVLRTGFLLPGKCISDPQWLLALWQQT